MEILNINFDKIIDEKNKEIEQLYLLKTTKKTTKTNTKTENTITDTNTDTNTNTDIIKIETKEEIDNKNIIDFRTKQTISKIKLELDRKYKSSKAYKKLTAL
jgi:hypothetical protein